MDTAKLIAIVNVESFDDSAKSLLKEEIKKQYQTYDGLKNFALHLDREVNGRNIPNEDLPDFNLDHLELVLSFVWEVIHSEFDVYSINYMDRLQGMIEADKLLAY